MKHRLWLAACGLLAACAQLPSYEPPAPAIAAQFDAGTGGGQLAGSLGWQQFFGDPQLKLLIATALSHNQDRAAALARIAQARAQYQIEDTARLPQVDAGANAARAQAQAGGSAVIASQYGVRAALVTYELDLWGRVASLSEVARRRYLATVEGERAFSLVLIGNLASTYYQIRAGEEGIALAQRTLAARRYALEIAQLRLDAGVTSSVDYFQAHILVTQAQTQLAELQRGTEQQRSRLMVLVGKPLGGPLPEPRAITDMGQFAALDAGLPSALLVSRPDVLQSEQLLRAADADIAAARAAYFPRIALTGELGFASAELGDLLQSGARVWSVGGLVSLPIFDGGRRDAQLGVAQARRDELLALYQRTLQTAFSEVSVALIGRRRYQEQISAQEAAVRAQMELAEVAELRYQNGISIYLEVVDAQRSLFAAEQQLIQLRALALQNGVALYLALGGGLDEPAAPALITRQTGSAGAAP